MTSGYKTQYYPLLHFLKKINTLKQILYVKYSGFKFCPLIPVS